MLHGLSLRQTAKVVGFSTTTVFHLRHKVMAAWSHYEEDSELKEEIQADETYFLLNMKGFKSNGEDRVMPRASKKRGTASVKRGISDEQVCVLCALDTSDNIVMKIIGQGNPTIKEIQQGLGQRLIPESILVTDSKSAYIEFSKQNNVKLIQIPSGFHTLDTYNLSSLNSLHSDIKQWFRKFRGVSTRHLQKYLNWYRYMKRLNYTTEYQYQLFKTFRYSASQYIEEKTQLISKANFPIDIYRAYQSSY